MNKVLSTGVALRAWLAFLAVASFSAEVGAQAGIVHEVSGSVTFQEGSAAPVPARVGDTFAAGAAFASSGDSRVTLQFADGQVLAVAPNSSVRIQQYQFDPRNVRASNVAITIQSGAVRLVSGVIGRENPQAVRITAGESTVSISRPGGSDFTVVLDARGPEFGVAAVARGEIAVRTPDGPIVRIDTDQAVPWRPGTTTAPIPIAAAPAVIQAELAGFRSLVLPPNNPIAVGPAAAAIAALAAARQVAAAAAASPENPELQATVQATAERAGSAVQQATAAAQDLLATVLASSLGALPATPAGLEATLESRLAALPATAAGLEPLTIASAALARADFSTLPLVPLPPVIPPGRCIGSPC
jgi:hypothetical protein